MKFLWKHQNDIEPITLSFYQQHFKHHTMTTIQDQKREVFLKKALQEAQRSLQDAYNGLSNVNEPELIDSYIYELNAAHLRYQVILRDYKSIKEMQNARKQPIL